MPLPTIAVAATCRRRLRPRAEHERPACANLPQQTRSLLPAAALHWQSESSEENSTAFSDRLPASAAQQPAAPGTWQCAHAAAVIGHRLPAAFRQIATATASPSHSRLELHDRFLIPLALPFIRLLTLYET